MEDPQQVPAPGKSPPPSSHSVNRGLNAGAVLAGKRSRRSHRCSRSGHFAGSAAAAYHQWAGYMQPRFTANGAFLGMRLGDPVGLRPQGLAPAPRSVHSGLGNRDMPRLRRREHSRGKCMPQSWLSTRSSPLAGLPSWFTDAIAARLYRPVHLESATGQRSAASSSGFPGQFRSAAR